MKLKRYFIVWIGVSLMLLTVLLTLFTTMADDGMVWDYQFLFEQVVKHFVTMIFPMCITLISGYMISREYTDDTLKNIETLPISFRKLLAGKLIVSAILSLFLGIVCFVFTVIANFIMGYDGFALIPALTGLVQMALLGFFLYLTMLPIIVLTSRHKGSFLVGVIVAFVYGFIGMFANGTLQSIYPVSAALGLINYRAGAEGVMWNKGLCFISILIMCAIGIALMFVKQKPEKNDPFESLRQNKTTNFPHLLEPEKLHDAKEGNSTLFCQYPMWSSSLRRTSNMKCLFISAQQSLSLSPILICNPHVTPSPSPPLFSSVSFSLYLILSPFPFSL